MLMPDAVAAACIITPIATAMPASAKCLMLNALQKSLFGLPKQAALHFNTGHIAAWNRPFQGAAWQTDRKHWHSNALQLRICSNGMLAGIQKKQWRQGKPLAPLLAY